MRIVRAKDYEDMSRKAGNIMAAQVVAKPDCVLGLATGSTPIGAYKRLVEGYEAGDLDFSQVKTYNLDEYRGLPGTHDQSYRYFMNVNLFDHVNIDKANTHVPDGLAEDYEAACAEYDAAVAAAGGQDLQLLGIGNNGHIGFNEPGDAFVKGTHCVDLTESTIQANSRLFDSIDDVPRQAYTMGIGTIMAAKMVLVMANGEVRDGQRRGQGPGRPRHDLRPDHPVLPGVHPAAAPQRGRRRRRGRAVALPRRVGLPQTEAGPERRFFSPPPGAFSCRAPRYRTVMPLG